MNHPGPAQAWLPMWGPWAWASTFVQHHRALARGSSNFVFHVIVEWHNMVADGFGWNMLKVTAIPVYVCFLCFLFRCCQHRMQCKTARVKLIRYPKLMIRFCKICWKAMPVVSNHSVCWTNLPNPRWDMVNLRLGKMFSTCVFPQLQVRSASHEPWGFPHIH